MKLLTEVFDISELNRLRLLLETSGVLIHIGNEDSARNFGFLHPVGKYAIHVVYDEQYNDALKLMEDENHVVENPLDVGVYKKHIEENSAEALSQLLKKTIFTGTIIALLVVCTIWFLMVLTK